MKRSRPSAAMRIAPAVFLLAAFSTPALRAQENPLAGRVRALNNQLLGVYAQLARSSPAEAAALRTQGGAIINERARALEDLIAQEAGQALKLAFSPDLLAQLAARLPQSASRLESHGSWQGSTKSNKPKTILPAEAG